MEYVLCQMDGILIFGATQSVHDEHIREVLIRPHKENVTLNSKKCRFSVQDAKFLGQTINESGISPDQDNVKAIIDMPEPTDVSGTRRFLGMINPVWDVHTIPSGDPKANARSSKQEVRLDLWTRTANVFCAAER